MASSYVCFLCYLEGGVLLSGLWGNDKSLVRWRWKPVGQTASKCGLHESPAYLERTGTVLAKQTELFWLNFSCASTRGVLCCVSVSNDRHPFLISHNVILKFFQTAETTEQIQNWYLIINLFHSCLNDLKPSINITDIFNNILIDHLLNPPTQLSNYTLAFI